MNGVLLSKINNVQKLEEKSLSAKDKLLSTMWKHHERNTATAAETGWACRLHSADGPAQESQVGGQLSGAILLWWTRFCCRVRFPNTGGGTK